MNFRILLLLLPVALSGCGGLPKPGSAPALYDFGIAASNAQSVPVRIVHVEAIPGLDGHEMRYRLTYQNPAQVFAYTESRWASLPADLVTQRFHGLWDLSHDADCSLYVTLEVFDQVFDSPAASRGVVQLRAELVRGVSGAGRNAARTGTVVKTEKTSASADAKGGVAALTAATDEAISTLTAWANQQQCKN